MSEREIGYREEMPWFGGCYHLWLDHTMIGSRPIKGFKRGCRLCGKQETWMYTDGGRVKQPDAEEQLTALEKALSDAPHPEYYE